MTTLQASDKETVANFTESLRRLRERTIPAVPWRDGGHLPWDQEDFSQRMLREHIDQSGPIVASKPATVVRQQVRDLIELLNLRPGDIVLDIACGPGFHAHELARARINAMGIDVAPSAIRYARRIAFQEQLPCTFIIQDVRKLDVEKPVQAAIIMFGQLNAFRPAETASLLTRLATAIESSGKVAAEVVDSASFDRRQWNMWTTVESSAFGDFPQLWMAERYWDDVQEAAIERHFILNMATGRLDEYAHCTQSYADESYAGMFDAAGFDLTDIHKAWHVDERAQRWQLLMAQPQSKGIPKEVPVP